MRTKVQSDLVTEILRTIDFRIDSDLLRGLLAYPIAARRTAALNFC